jgi:hypothetical protein
MCFVVSVCVEKEGAANHIMELSKTISCLQEALSNTKAASEEALKSANTDFTMRLEMLSQQQDVRKPASVRTRSPP